MLDTDVAMHLRDGVQATIDRVAAMGEGGMISVITRVKLEGGVYQDPRQAMTRRVRLDAILVALPTIPFDDDAADAYRAIIEARGFSRRKILDRMIAAQALVRRATLVTLNAADFQDVPGLDLLAW